MKHCGGAYQRAQALHIAPQMEAPVLAGAWLADRELMKHQTAKRQHDIL